MRIKKDDKVKVISGEYKGVEGHVLKYIIENNKLIEEKVNFIKKHQRLTQQNPSGGVFEMEAPIYVSNVQFICPKCRKPSKVKI